MIHVQVTHRCVHLDVYSRKSSIIRETDVLFDVCTAAANSLGGSSCAKFWSRESIDTDKAYTECDLSLLLKRASQTRQGALVKVNLGTT
jgi:hypothetical protein